MIFRQMIAPNSKPYPFFKHMPASLINLLTPREKEVLRLIGEGLRNKEIGIALGISEQTVETHRKNIKRKLQAKDTADLLRMAALITTT